jgi:hypothetical protein
MKILDGDTNRKNREIQIVVNTVWNTKRRWVSEFVPDDTIRRTWWRWCFCAVIV